MASWLTKGYVSDSDDDEEALDNSLAARVSIQKVGNNPYPNASLERGDKIWQDAEEHDSASRSRNSSPTRTGSRVSSQADDLDTPADSVYLQRTAEKLEASLRHGLSIVRDVLSLSPSPAPTLRTPQKIDNDSPLSTPPDSPTISPIAHIETPVPDGPGVEQPRAEYAPQRSLRQRTARQLNPYTLDWATYSRLCAERGIKPVRLPRAALPLPQQNQEDSQNAQSAAESQSRDSPRVDPRELDDNSNSLEEFHDLPSSAYEVNQGDGSANDDLPDLDLLLTGKPTTKQRHKTVGKPAKNKTDKRTAHLPQIFDLPSSDDENVKRSKMLKQRPASRADQNSFPSPPRSTSLESVVSIESPPLISQPQSPAALPTPVLSSAARARRRLAIEDDSQSGPEQDAARESSPEAESGEDETQVVRAMQKRVKGVLPASWLSIDRAQREINKKWREEAQNKSNSGRQAGVAQRMGRVSAGQAEYRSASLWEDLLSDDGSDDDTTIDKADGRSKSGSYPNSDKSDLPSDFEAAEVVDLDGFDPMLPSHRRKRRMNLLNFGQRKRKQPMSTSTSASASRRNAGKFNSSSAYQTLHPRRKRKVASHHDVVHTLDAPDLLNCNDTTRPPYLRLAARQAKKMSGFKRGVRASEKFFQLAAEEDTEEVLRDFRQRRNNRQNGSASSGSILGRPRVLAIPTNDEVTYRPSANREGITSDLQDHRQVAQVSDDTAATEDDMDTTEHAGIVIQCGRQEERSPRLTRLQNLLPLTNRSGRGKLDSHLVGQRTAQMEVPLLTSFKSSRQFQWPDVPKTIQRPQLLEIVNGLHRSKHSPDVDARRSAARSTKPKKQKPSHRPTLQQTLLVAAGAPNSERLESLLGAADSQVRNVLEKEFSEYQTAWFQGSKANITVANDATQRHFRVFLQLLKSYLPVALQDAEDERELRELKSFVHRLIPNRGQIGAQGQIGDKVLDVLEYDLIIARNVFELHTCLLNLAPSWAPLPRLLEMKVNFADAHHEVCLIALDAWKEVYDAHHTHPAVVDGLASWLYNILLQVFDRWISAETGARSDAFLSMRRIDEQLVRKVIEHNRKQASKLLMQVVEILGYAIDRAVSTAEITLFFNVERYLNYLGTLSNVADFEAEVLAAVFEIVDLPAVRRWLHSQPSVVAQILPRFRQNVTKLTSSAQTFPTHLCRAAIKAYFIAASIAVSQLQRSWDEFFEPRSSHCLDMFIPHSHIDVMKTFFCHYLLEHDPNTYLMELRPAVLTHWVHVLLQAREDDLSCSLLTASIFRYEKESLSMPELSTRFMGCDGNIQDESVRRSLPEIRSTTVTHMLAALHAQEFNSEAEWLAGGLDDADAVRLLRTMFSTMKSTWIGLKEHPEEQDTYTVLVYAALELYEAHPRNDFQVEPWFLSSATFPQPKKQILSKLLTSDVEPGDNFEQATKEAFWADVDHAKRHKTIKHLENELKDIFLQTDHEFSTLSSYVAAKQAMFVHKILHPTLAEAHSGTAEVRIMVVNVLLHTMDNFECRSDASNPSMCQVLVEATATTMQVLCGTLMTYENEDRQKIYRLASLTFDWAVATLAELPQSFLDDIEMISECAATEDTEEAYVLLRTVMQYR